MVVSAVVAAASCTGSRREPPRPMAFAEAAAEVEALTRAKGRDGLSSDGERLDGVLLFELHGDSAALITAHRDRLLRAGAYLFLYEDGFGRSPDMIGLAPTTDKFDLVRRVRTDGIN